MPRLVLPGPRTGVAYIWAIVLAPLLLLLASVALLVMGLWRHVDSVAAIGAIGIVASLVLPRMRGAFEIGPAGIKGDLESEVHREVIQKARESGLDAAQALELADDATGSPASSGSTSPDVDELQALRRWRNWSESGDPHAAMRWRLAERVANEFVGESVRLQTEVGVIVDRVAHERGWDVQRDVRGDRAAGGTLTRVFDFVVTTPQGPIFIEAVNFRQPRTLDDVVSVVNTVLADRDRVAAFVVVPNVRFSVYTRPDVEVVPVGDLERRLREIQP